MISLTLLVTLLFVILAVWVLFYLVDMIPFPGPVPMVIKIIIGIAALIFAIQKIPFLSGIIS